jgi:vacuolar-type H+-ATPase subunit H
MPKQTQRPRQLDSFIPAIRTEERRLDDLLAGARERAEHIVRDAQVQAGARVEAARKALPGLMEERRQARRGALEQTAADAAAREEARERETVQRARAALDETVRFIVSAVWPAGERTENRPW